jgi:hypothetical protein
MPSAFATVRHFYAGRYVQLINEKFDAKPSLCEKQTIRKDEG